MSKFNVVNSTLNTTYNFENENVVVNGSFQKDAQSGELQNISGTAYKPNAEGGQGQYIGNFNGRMQNGVMRYSLSDMTRQDTLVVLDAIDEIEQYINGENVEE